MNTSRRSLLKSVTALSGTAVLGGCGVFSVSTDPTNPNIKNLNVNVAKIDAYAQAAQNAADMVIRLPGLNIDPVIAGTIATAGAVIAADIKAFDTAAGGTVTLTIDTTNPANIVNSILTDCENILKDLRSALGATVSTMAQEYIDALATVVSLFQAMMPTSLAAATEAPKMSETNALHILGVRAPMAK